MVGVEKACPCGLGSCLVLTANTERNRGRKFFRCPNRQYHRIYSPISFGKKHDPNGDFIRHFLPVLKDMPKQYIYEPWTAPKSLQVKAKCIIGKDYPSPVLSHDSASKECKRKLAEAYALNRQSNGVVSEDDLGKLRQKLEEDQQTQKPAAKKQKQKLVFLSVLL